MNVESDSVEAQRLRAALQKRLFERGEALPTIGRFDVRAPLGRGGMGVVYRAHDPDLDREVALKLVRTRAESSTTAEQARARMLREAKVLARLQHPNVVTIHEVGVFEEEVFVAMELLGGGDLSQWVARNDTFDRTRFVDAFDLLIEAGRGLAAAHALGVVHRDFKPSNVLLGEDGHARVGDFGLARAGAESRLSSEQSVRPSLISENEPLTATGARLGTRAYMPPEQARGEAVDAAADQYAFCVTAIEVLSGSRPTAASDVPGRVSGVPGWVWSPLRRGLAPSPMQRWPSMSALLDELERRARPKWALWGLAGVGVLAAAFTLRPEPPPPGPSCDAGDARVAEVWNAARRQALVDGATASGLKAAETVVSRAGDRLDGWFAGWSEAFDETCRAHHDGGALTVAEYDGRTRCLDNQLRRAAVLIDAVADAPSNTVGRLGVAAAALPSVRRCEEPLDPRRDASVPADPREAAAYAAIQDEVARRQALRDLFEWEEAHDGAIELAARAAAYPNTPAFAEATLAEGLALGYAGRPDEAIVRFEAVARMAATLGEHELEGQAWATYGNAVGGTPDKYDVADLAFENASAAIDRLSDPRRARARMLFMQGSMIYQKRGESGQAIDLLQASVRLLEDLRGPENPELIGVLAALGQAQSKAVRTKEAEITLERALGIVEANFGPEHPTAADLHDVLAESLAGERRFEEALVHAREASRIAALTLPPDAKLIGIYSSNLAIAELEAGDAEAALVSIAHAIESLKRSHGETHYQVGGSGYRVQAAAYLALGRHEEALAAAARDIELCEAGLGKDHFWLSAARHQRARIHQGRGDFEAALTDHQESLRIEQVSYTLPHTRLVRPWRRVAADLRTLGRFEEARQALEQARSCGGSPRQQAPVELEAARLARASGGDPSGPLETAQTLADEAHDDALLNMVDTVRDELSD